MKPSPAPSTLNTSTGKPEPDTPVQAGRDRPLECGRSQGTTFTDERCPRHLPHRAQSGEDVGRTARDVELLLRADDEVEERQVRPEPGRHVRAFHEAALSLAVARHSPKVPAMAFVKG